MNVSDIKKELQNLGLSTATPGLVGDERFEELKYRLEQAQGVLQEQGLIGNEGKSIKAANAATSLSGKAADHGLGQLTIGELRSRLTALGLSTVTPGQTGEERCNTLMQRLVEAICGTSPCEEEEQKPEVKRPAPVQRRAPPTDMPPPDESPPKTSPIKQEEVPPNQEEDYEAEESPQFVDESVAQSEINELKKLMKRMSNKRSIYIASKLSGTNQDYSLKEMSDRLADVEADITFCKNSKQRGENKIKADLMRTKLKLWSMSKIPTIGVDEGVAQLEFVKTDLKEQIRVRRLELKEEAEIHPEFGIQAEENLRQQMSQAALVNTKMNRTRHKINDAKGIDAPKSVLSATQSAKESPSPSSKAIQSTPQSEPKSKLVLNESQSVVSSASNSPQKKDDLEFVSSFLGKKLDFSTAKAPSVESSSSTSKNNNYQNIVNSSHSMPKTIISSPDRNLDSKKMVNPSKKLIESSDSDHSGDENNDESSSDYGDESSEDEKRHKGVKKKYHAQINPKQPSPLISKGNSNAALNEPPMLVRNDSSIEEIIKLSRPDSKGQSPDYDDSANAGQFSTKQLLDESRQEKSAKQKMDELLSMPSHRDQLTEEEEAVRSDEIEQIKVLREHAKTLEKLDDLLAAEVLHERALELDPTDIRTLQGYAMFLHQKKGELARAEAFFNRALQLSFPSLYTQLHTPHLRKSLLDASSPAALDKTLSAFSPPSKTSLSEISFRDDKIKIKHVVNLLMTFSNFMSKSKGDIEAAAILLQKASALAEDDAFPQATYAHFCSIHTDVCKDVAERDVDTLFRKAMKLDPKNPVYKMWYAKFLKRLGKLGPAELMYQAALETSRGHPKNEATAICNYATFLFKQRKSTDKAGNLFEIGLSTFPEHRGLRKNFAQLQKKLLKLEAKNNQDIPTKALDVISTAPQLAAESKPVAPNLKIDTGVNEFTLSTSPARRSENSSPMKKRDITSSQSRGSRRAQRMQQSLVTQIPTELDNSESRSNFILTQLGVADRLVSSSEGLKDKNALIKEVDVEDDDEDEIIGNNKFLEKLRGTPLLPKKKQDPSSILSPKAEKQDLSAWTETEGKSLFFRDGSSSNLLTEDETGVVPLSAIAADLNELGARPSTSFRQSHPEYKYYEDDENDEDEDENDIDDYM